MAPATLAKESLTQRYENTFPHSRELFEQARNLFPNGVTHDLRHLEPFPIYINRAEGAYKWDVDGHRLIDYWSGHGALLLGHSHPAVVEAVQRQVSRATHPGACHELEIEWASWVQRLVPSAQKLRFVSSGTEATLMAIRLSRIFTGRPKILKFAGHFHGWHDSVTPASDAPSVQSVPGVSQAVGAETIVIPPNDPAEVERVLSSDSQIGCVILEPTGGHFGSVPIGRGFLSALRELTTRHGCLLIFDEVITGFRVHPGGAQGIYGVLPDLTSLAKVLAGGLPGGCLAGRADVLASLESRPGKPKMKHPGTFNANPLSAAAGTAALRLVSTGEPCQRANDMGRLLRQKLNAMFVEKGVPWVAYGAFSGFKLVPDYHGSAASDDDFVPYEGKLERLEVSRRAQQVHAFRRAMLLHGIDLPGLGGMTTAAHAEKDIDQTVAAVAAAVETWDE